MLITIFRSRLRPEHTEEYAILSARMNELTADWPGLIGYKTFTAPDGERVTIVEFENEEAQSAWRHQTEHRSAQHLGRAKFYSEYRITVCSPIREHRFEFKDQ